MNPDVEWEGGADITELEFAILFRVISRHVTNACYYAQSDTG